MMKGKDYAYNISNTLKKSEISKREGLKLLVRSNKVSGLLNEMERENLLIKTNPPSEKPKNPAPVYFEANKNAFFLRMNYFPNDSEIEEMFSLDKKRHEDWVKTFYSPKSPEATKAYEEWAEKEKWEKPAIHDLIYSECGETNFCPINDPYNEELEPFLGFDILEFTDTEILQTLSLIKKFDYITILLMEKELLTHIVAILNYNIVKLEPSHRGIGVPIYKLPKSREERKKSIKKWIDQLSIVLDEDYLGKTELIDFILMEMDSKEDCENKPNSALFPYLTYNRVINSAVADLNKYGLVDGDNKPVDLEGVIVCSQRFFEAELVFIDSLLTLNLMNDRMKKSDS